MNANCTHDDFHADFKVTLLEDVGEFVLDIKVKCAKCNQPFRFPHVPPGINQKWPCVNIDATELSVHIEPEGVKKLFNTMPVRIPPLPEKV